MIGCNLKNAKKKKALNYLNALHSQFQSRKDRSSPDQREYNQGPQIRQATEQNDRRHRVDFQLRQINCYGGDQFNRNGRMRRLPRAYKGRCSNDGGRRRRHTRRPFSRLRQTRIRSRGRRVRTSLLEARRNSQPVQLQNSSNGETLNRI
jgi:hypothetical protein